MPALAESPLSLPRMAARAGAGPSSTDTSGIESTTIGHHSHTPESLDRLAHDARNVLSGLTLYCGLLAAPGVLNSGQGHYAQELESIVGTATWMLEKIVDIAKTSQSSGTTASRAVSSSAPLQIVRVTDAAEELRRAQPLLAAIAGPAIRLSVATMPCAGQTALALEDFTRILVNLVRNSSDAMPAGGHIRITAQYGEGISFLDSAHPRVPRYALLTVTDDGPGIPEPLRAQVFDLGFTTRNPTGWATPRRRGLGLNIVRNLVETAGGSVEALAAPGGGARFEIRLPLSKITSGMCRSQPQSAFAADARGEGCIKCL